MLRDKEIFVHQHSTLVKKEVLLHAHIILKIVLRSPRHHYASSSSTCTPGLTHQCTDPLTRRGATIQIFSD